MTLRSLLVGVASLLAAHQHHQTAAHAPGCHTRSCDRRIARLWRRHHPFTGYVVTGPVSDFGAGTGDGSQGVTADGGSTTRPCIALRERWSLGHWFQVTVLGHTARLLHCDWGPAASTGRDIDITGAGAVALRLDPIAFPTGAAGTARELR